MDSGWTPQLDTENDVELKKVGGKPPGKAKSKTHTTQGGRNHPYTKNGGVTVEKQCSHCARPHGKEAPCPAIRLTCFNCNKIGHLKAACRKAVVAASASNTENEPMAAGTLR